jgi:hypothetical protein
MIYYNAMDWMALLSSCAVHVATAMVATHPIPAGSTTYGKNGVGDGGGSRRVRASHSQLITSAVPRIFLAGHALPNSGYDYGARISHSDCPLQADLGREASARFALFGPAAPFAWVAPVGLSPELCIRIEANGRVSHVRMIEGSGDADVDSRIVRDTMALNFEAARRGGRPTAAWHRLIVNRPLGARIEPATPIVAY